MGRVPTEGRIISDTSSGSEFETPPTLPKKGSEYLTISDDRSAGSNLEARNLAALIDRAASKEDKLHAVYPQKARPKISRTSLPPKFNNSASLLHARMQQRFGQLRLRPELRDDIQPGINNLNEEDGEQATNADDTGKKSNRMNGVVEKSEWVDSGDEIEPRDRLWTDMATLQRKITEMQKELHNLQKQKDRNPKKRYQILYRIHGECYLDHPEWNQSKTQIMSHIPLQNLELFLERNKSILFIVYRDFQNGVSKPENGEASRPRHITESVHLIDTSLREVFEGFLKQDWRYRDDSQRLEKNGEINAPYLFVYHHRYCWKDILSHFSRTVRKRLNLLASYISRHYGHEYMAADALFSRRKVSVEYLKYLFQPGDILISLVDSQYRGLIASSWPGKPVDDLESEDMDHEQPPQVEHLVDSGWARSVSDHSESDGSVENNASHHSAFSVTNLHSNERNRPRYTSQWTHLLGTKTGQSSLTRVATQRFTFRVFKWSFDGDFKREEETFHLRLSPRAPGTLDILKEWDMHSLDIYPLEYAPQEIQIRLRQRGRMFWDCRKRCQVSYHQADTDADNESDERFMIDFHTFRKLHPNNASRIVPRPLEVMSEDEMKQNDPPDEAFFYLVPLETKGFNLRTKKWHDLKMDQVRPVVWNQQAFNSLVLDRKTKELITALVSKQISAAKSTDVVAGKGNGLILLLHGGPGTGKTLTAEGVAEIAKKPLYRVTCGDVGTKAEEVEKYLESVLHLGKLWDCVVLLDEAEVFLERRSLDDLQRNALVSVFLRVIEYHEGILILTSNRVGTFDEAFRSRIQIAVHYPPLRAYQRLQIWRNFFDRLESFNDGKVDVDDLRDHLEELQEIEINGRQIRNAITTARQYAEWKEKVMNYEHLTTALEVASKFNDYSEKLRGGLTDDQIAEEEGIR